MSSSAAGDPASSTASAGSLLPSRLRAILLAAAFAAGAGIMIVEVAGVRALAPWFGTTTSVWTNVLGVVLAALAAGGALGGYAADRRPEPRLAFGALAGAGVACAASPIVVRFLGPRLSDPTLPLPLASSVEPLGSLVAAAAGLAPPVFLLGGAIPCCTRLLVRGREEVGRRAGAVYALSTAGSLVGTMLSPRWLVPTLGVDGTFRLTAILLVATAGAGILLTSGRGASRLRAILVGGLATLALAFAPASPPPPIPSDFELVESLESEIHLLRVLETEGGTRSLAANEDLHGFQSVRIPGERLTGGRYYDALGAVSLAAEDGDGVLTAGIVGFGAGSLAHVLEHVREGIGPVDVSGVEVDRAIFGLAVRHLGFESAEAARWNVTWGEDGRRWLVRASHRFEFLAVDAFAQGSEIPFHLVTEEFFRLAESRTLPGGIVAVNVSALAPDAPLVSAVANTMALVFGSSYVLPVPDQRNFVVAARRSEPFPDAASFADAIRRVPGLEALGLRWGDVGGIRRWTFDPRKPFLTDDRAPIERLTRLALSAG